MKNAFTPDRALWRKGLAAAGLAVLVAQVVWWLPSRVQDDELSDPDVYHQAAARAAAGEQVYGRQARVQISDVPSGFFYPPSALALLAPARFASKDGMRLTCFGLAIASAFVLAAALVKIGTGAASLPSTLIVGAFIAMYPPAAQSMNTGNLDMAVVAMTAWAFASPRLAAPLLVAAAAIKVYPGFALVAWVVRGDRKFRQQVLTSVAVAVATTLLLVDFKYIKEWLALGLPSLNLPATHPGNWSLSLILIYPTLHDVHALTASTSAVARAVLSLAPMAAAVVAAVVTRRKPLPVAAMAALMAGTWFTALCWWWRILLLVLIPAAAWYAHKRASFGGKIRDSGELIPMERRRDP